MIPFDPVRTPLEGVGLIEAAAGTGKTHTIEGLFIRLALESGLPVEQILVVTFTRAATAELRDRIYRRLVTARDVLDGAPAGDDELLAHLAAEHPDPPAARRLLHQALVDFDRAGIFTIHGFCQRVLHDNAFETQSPFSTRMIEDQERILAEVVDDFWRRQVTLAPPEFIRFARAQMDSPEDLRDLARASIAAEFSVTPPSHGPGLSPRAVAAFRDRLKGLQAIWPGGREEAGHILLAAALNARIYGATAAEAPGAPAGRQRKITELLETLDAYTMGQLPAYPPPAALERLSSATLARHTRARHPAPGHPLFDACELLQRARVDLDRQMRAHLLHVKSTLLGFVRTELERRKAERGLISYDDLLRRLAQALDRQPAAALVAAVRRRYRAALVDEFQDTDELQYRVFSKLFGAPGQLLFMIGDPKQAIYGFRGADIFSYLRAARDAKARYTLTTNWRSAPGLVQAVNTLFSRAPAPFLFPRIGFIPGRSARGDLRRPGPALELWYLDARRRQDGNGPMSKAQAQRLIARAVTGEIRAATAGGALTGRTGEIAVLVRTNREARLMKEHFAAAGVPSVLYSTADVFESPEAADLATVLASVAEPHSPGRLKSALSSRLLGLTAGALAGDEATSAVWEERIRRHWEYLNLWREQGFMPMFRQLLARETVRERLLSWPDGERRLTNVLHLAELLHRAAADTQLGVSGLLKWFIRQVGGAADRSEEHQLRLESDARAVKIVTIHRSKGLEYPVVYCPFTWAASAVRGDDFFFHDPRHDFQLTADLSGERESPNRRSARNEALSENLRMLYVALTRARERCTLVWGRINTAESSALAYLLRATEAPTGADGAADWVEHLKAEFKTTDDAQWRERLEALADASGGSIRVRALPDPAPIGTRESPAPAAPPVCRTFAGRIDASWRITSYSALAAGAGGTADRADPAAAAGDDAGAAAASPSGLHGFPAGARSGNFFHALLEAVDFTGSDAAAVVAQKLSEFGFDPCWTEPVSALVQDLAAVALEAAEFPLRLGEVAPERCIREMEFYFPLHPVDPARLEDLLAPGRPAAEPSDELPPLQFAPTQGFMRGFIDLVCEHRGRFYLIDWKSNRLGADTDAYRRERLGRAMQAHRYDLQIHLYSLALHQLLRQRLPDYLYERDFGGAIYVFLRGVNRELAPDAGIYTQRPERGLIDTLGRALIPSYG
ncbi:MAG: exodeoxyribonuclease V subunit beta [Desulfobacterales bacterium]|jgi:exodeoxyribonuclease V beta subunit|nr:exodeoxyribonuclease V subunit beta [Desulfobacterales bacterium]